MEKPKAVYTPVEKRNREGWLVPREVYPADEMDAFHKSIKKRLIDSLIVAGSGKAGGLFALKETIWDVCKELEKEARV